MLTVYKGANVIGNEQFDIEQYRGELDEAPSNRAVGTTLWFENDRVKVWEVRLEAGQRAPFHTHAMDYFWTCIDPGDGYQRYDDGSAQAFDFKLGETELSSLSEENPKVHDLENRGDSLMRFVAVE